MSTAALNSPPLPRLRPSDPARSQAPAGRSSRWSLRATLSFPLRMASNAKSFELNCCAGEDRDLSTSALAGGLADCLDDSPPPQLAELKRREPSIATMLTNIGNSFDPYGALSTPLYQTSTFNQPSATEYGPYDYTRTGNPTRDVLQSLMAKLEKADAAFCFTSGMSALTTVTKLVEPGQEIVAGDDIYGGSDRLLQLVRKRGVVVKQVNTCDLSEVSSAISPMTKLVWLESPTNPRLQIADIRKIIEIAHSQGALVMVDNSIMSPVLSLPLELGADIVMESATKFVSGHSDLMAGILAVKGESLSEAIAFLQNAEGNGLAPFDCWLCLRGIKTMALRVEKQQVHHNPNF
ncbi:cystathionine beta-lyase, chloroplastic-like isoform X2 [Asparagus officinalis]|uniref:cystathionine beta-lyase, chloroplastic-like isoform X2 n=1 Tax=Asparagus officinalis TaxID=4686 RepID=UPI00098DF2B4|nr:cystathionine beta-lyase, chloroplastic-like isoform X2 [Asparagus officinalis]